VCINYFSSLPQRSGIPGKPCAADGTFLPTPTPEPILDDPMDALSENLWAPFKDRVAFDFAQYHYVELQSSEGEIAKGLDLLCAMGIKYGSRDGSPWKSVKELYATIDSIQTCSTPWKTYKFKYTGPKPSMPPRWMDEEYKLNLRDILKVFEQELLSSEFEDECDYSPYLEFDPQGNRVWSNLMSGDWAHRQAVRSSFTFILLH
jgi:Plavaka transposase